MKHLILLLIFILFLICPLVFGQEAGGIALSLSPGMNIPLFDSTELFSIGGGAGLHVKYSLPFLALLQAKGGLEYTLAPTTAQGMLNTLGIDAGVGVNIAIIPKLDLNIFGMGGYFIGMYEDVVGSSPFVRGGLEITYLLDPAFSLGAGGSYNFYLSGTNALNQGVGVHLCATYILGAGMRKPEIDLQYIELLPVFPVFSKYYDDNALGKIKLVNKHAGSINDAKVSFFVKQYMDSPKTCVQIKEIKQDEAREIDIFALFSDNIMGITEATKAQAEITVTYTYLDSEYTSQTVETLRIYDRNAMIWDDDNKAASFVTSKDPNILKFSKNYAGAVQESVISGVSKNFRVALGLFEALRLHGIKYVQDPKTPYAEFSQQTTSLDFLQFPVQTLEYKAGDCDDLSILYCALLESIGIETGFITIPGHIYMALSLDMDESSAKKAFFDSGKLMFIEDTAWIPVEITMVTDGFLKAWERGAREWRDNESANAANFYPIHTAWQLYEPVGISGAEKTIPMPDITDVERAYKDEFNKFIDMQLKPQLAELNEQIKKSKNNPRYINRLGTLYAQYGKLAEAEAQFKKLTGQNEYVPALVNLGNIYYMRKDFKEALKYYSAALEKNPKSPVALLGVAKTNYELENKGSVNEAYAELEKISPTLADKHAYLVSATSDTARASSQDIRKEIEWDLE